MGEATIYYLRRWRGMPALCPNGRLAAAGVCGGSQGARQSSYAFPFSWVLACVAAEPKFYMHPAQYCLQMELSCCLPILGPGLRSGSAGPAESIH